MHVSSAYSVTILNFICIIVACFTNDACSECMEKCTEEEPKEEDEWGKRKEYKPEQVFLASHVLECEYDEA